MKKVGWGVDETFTCFFLCVCVLGSTKRNERKLKQCKLQWRRDHHA